MVPLVSVWGGRFSAARRPEGMSLCVVSLGVSWPWLLVDEWCCESWSRNDGDNVSLNRCVLVSRAGEGWREWIIRDTETVGISALSSYRDTVRECSEEKTRRSVCPLSPKAHLLYGAFFVLTVDTLGLHRATVCTGNWNVLRRLVTRIECQSLCE